MRVCNVLVEGGFFVVEIMWGDILIRFDGTNTCWMNVRVSFSLKRCKILDTWYLMIWIYWSRAKFQSVYLWNYSSGIPVFKNFEFWINSIVLYATHMSTAIHTATCCIEWMSGTKRFHVRDSFNVVRCSTNCWIHRWMTGTTLRNTNVAIVIEIDAPDSPGAAK